jgi:hypothetical protein
MHTLLVNLLFLSTLVHGALWQKESIRANARLKQCFRHEHASLVNALFPPNSLEQEEREAVTLDYLARLIKTGGTHFCDSFQNAVISATHTLRRRAELNTTWQTTLEQFERDGLACFSKCIDATHEYRDVRSKRIKCIDKTMRQTIYALIIAQYADDEQRDYQ